MGLLQDFYKGKGDWRILFVMTFIVLLFPYLVPLGIPVPISQSTRDFKSVLDNIPSGGTVMIDFEGTPASWANLGALTVAVSNVCFERDINIIYLTFAMEAPDVHTRIVENTKLYDTLVYGEDYMNVGYVPGVETGMASWAADTRFISIDHHGNDVASLPIMKDIHTMGDLDAVIFVSGTTPDPWFRQFGPYNVPLLSGAQGGLVPIIQPYYQSGQLAAYLDDVKGAAELEQLSGIPGLALSKMDQVNLLYIFAVLLIIMGNLGRIMGKEE
ncbi:hypothetical protein ACFL0D_05370 [Thermoproteota archaeon]